MTTHRKHITFSDHEMDLINEIAKKERRTKLSTIIRNAVKYYYNDHITQRLDSKQQKQSRP